MFIRQLAPTFFTGLTGKILLLVLLYIITGKIGLMLALPPGYATVIWPPSGIAIGMLIVHGWRLWPGVLIGSFILNCYISGAYSLNDGLDIGKALTALGIAVGSTIQAFAGWLMTKRLLGLPLLLNHVKEMVALFIVCGPVACLIAASIGVSTLYISGALPLAEVTSNWLTWWLGDLFGVLVFLPLVLVAPGGGKITWRGNQLGNLPIIAMLALVMPLGLTFYAWKITSENVLAQQQAEFETIAQENKQALLGRITSYGHALLGGLAYFHGSTFVERDEWRSYINTINIQENFPGINGIGYIEVVEEKDIPDYLANARKSIPNFSIHPETKDRPYYIINYLEPNELNKWVPGLNIAFEDNRLEAANLARDSGKPAITRKITLVQDAEKTPGFLLLHPYYGKSPYHNSPEERRKAIKGWIYAPFIAKNFLKDLTKSQGVLLNLKIYDNGKESDENLIYSSVGDTLAQPLFTLRTEINIMQQKWLVVWTSTLAYEQMERSDEPLFVMIGGLLFTGLFGLFLMVVAVRRTDTMEWMLKDQGYVVPIVIFVVTFGGTFYLYNVLEAREEQAVRSIISEQAEKLRMLIEVDANNKLLSLKRMGLRWEAAGGTPEHLWRKDTYNYIGHLSGLTTLEWVDNTYHVRWVEPVIGNEKVIGLNIRFNKERENALKGAAERETITITPPLDLVQGYKAFIAYSPIKIQGKFDGFMTAIFSIDEFFNESIAPEARRNFDILMLHEDKPFFENKVLAPLEKHLAFESSLQVYDKKWTLRLIPTEAYVRSNYTSLPSIIFAAGFLIATLLSLIIRMVLIAKVRALYLAEEQKRLSDIVAIQRDVAHAHHRLEEAMNLIVKRTQIITSADGSVIEMLEGDTMCYRAASGKAANFLGLRLNAKASLSGLCIQQNTTLICDDCEADERVDKEACRKIGILSMVLVPLNDGKKQVGVLKVFSAKRNAFNDQHVTSLQLLGGVLSAALSDALINDTLRQSEETFRSAIENASIGMAIVAPNGRWLQVNKALCDILGYSKQELLENDFQSITHPDDLAADLTYTSQMLTNEINMYKIEKRYYHKTGKIIWALLSVSLVRDNAGNPNYFIAQIQDITEQKEMERIKSEFISIVSHELRTPLTSIRGSLGLILGALSKDLPAKVKGLIEIAHNNSERLILLINDILDIDKIAAGQMRMDIKEESLEVLTQQVVQANEAYAQKFKVFMDLLPFNEDFTVQVDATRYAQVISNLLSNAIKFSPQQGIVQVFAERHSDHVRISVKDNGPGIAEEFRARIFGKFSQADSSVTRTKGGTGLGLHITKQLIEQMKGTIGFDSEIGKGTTFWIELPIVQKQSKSAQMDTSKVTDLRITPHLPLILHVEDDADLSNVLATALHDKVQFLNATTLRQAKQYCSSMRFDMLILDQGLPDGDGLLLLDCLKESHMQSVPVIILSTDAPSQEVRRQVAAIMIKSRVSETKIVETILNVLKAHKEELHGK